MRLTHALAALLLVAPVCLPTASAETPQATLRLLVVDQTNAVLPHATVSIYTLDGQPGVRATADEHGIVICRPWRRAHADRRQLPRLLAVARKGDAEGGDNLETVKLRLAPVVEKVTVRPTSNSSNRSS